MIEKTLSTFHPGNIVLQQQYKNSKYEKYSDLSEVLSVAEQQKEVLMSNHSARPIGSIVLTLASIATRFVSWKRHQKACWYTIRS
jgi:hypothetical protein